MLEASAGVAALDGHGDGSVCGKGRSGRLPPDSYIDTGTELAGASGDRGMDLPNGNLAPRLREMQTTGRSHPSSDLPSSQPPHGRGRLFPLPLESGQFLSGLLLADRGEIWVSAHEGVTWPPRRRFTIGHELGHWCMHRTGDGSVFCRSTSIELELTATAERPPLSRV